MIDLEEQLTDHLRNRAALVLPRYDLESVEHGTPSIEFAQRDSHASRRPFIGALVGAAAALAIVALVVTLIGDDHSTVVTTPTTDPTSNSSVFGTWVSTDTDGSFQTMQITSVGEGSAEMTVHDAVANVCAGLPSTMTGSGKLDSNGVLVIASPRFTCDDGSEPALLDPPIAERLRNLTLTRHAETDTLTDSLGVVWRRDGSHDPNEVNATSGGMWPQSSVDEVKTAQQLADAGDPDYTWQADSQLNSQEWWSYIGELRTEIINRFLREELGWDAFRFNTYQGEEGDGAADGVLRDLRYLRCAPGETNSLYPTESCEPTIDELRYETVTIDLVQLDRLGPTGLWVVRGWSMSAGFTQADPVASEAEVTTRLENFMQARIDGQGADNSVAVYGDSSLDEVPLLYATTTGSPYERYEIERVSGPDWPFGNMEFNVRLFADGGETVVEQQISWSDVGRGIELWIDDLETTENGQPPAIPYSFFDGEVTTSAAYPWDLSFAEVSALVLNGDRSEYVELVENPVPVGMDCAAGATAIDATALAQTIQSDSGLVTTSPVAVTIGGIQAISIDIALAAGGDACEPKGGPETGGDRWRTPLSSGSRMRLYLVDLPDGSTTRILAIAIVAPEARFEALAEAAAPIIASITFHPTGS